jgi:dTDP-4-dehydrorhamnose 3,5-epimerase
VKVTEFKIKGPLLIEPKMVGDARGFFIERYRRDLFSELGLPDFIQDNYSRSSQGVLRGLHYQYDRPQSKLVTVVSGVIYDVAVDIRRDSPTFGQHLHVQLDGDRPAWLWVPAGFAHGFEVLSSQGADVAYKVDAAYNPSGEGGILWNDPDLGIEWPIGKPTVSERDRQQVKWQQFAKEPKF